MMYVVPAIGYNPGRMFHQAPASFSLSHAQASPPPPVWRRLFHLTAGSAIPVAGLLIPSPQFILALAVLLGVAFAVEGVRFMWDPLNRLLLRLFSPLLKQQENRRLTGSTYMIGAGLAVFLLFDTHIAAAAMLFLALGDPVAALVGTRLRGPRFFGKSPVGTAAFVAVSLGACAVLVSAGVVPFHWGLLAGAVAAGIVELLPIPLDDNLTIPLASGAVMYLLGT